MTVPTQMNVIGQSMLDIQRIYLNVPFAEKDEAKRLGARWDPSSRAWYILPHIDTAPFQRWLKIQPTQDQSQNHIQHQQMHLSHYLRSVEHAVEQSFEHPEWVICTVSDWRQNPNGHIYAEFIEQNEQYQVIAKSTATLWSNQVQQVLAPFIQATGAPPSTDMKLLVQVSAHFHSRYGFSLNIHALDPNFTLGALEAKLHEIRSTLQDEHIFDHNRTLVAPTEFTHLAVISSSTAAGLGDFRQEADRLTQTGLCQFDYFYATMQGMQTCSSICEQLNKINQQSEQYDAIIIIRGGGAKTDLADFNDIALARSLCHSPLPIFVGIGHERDHTILDEIAQRSFDTPSKVSHYILQTIVHNALSAYQHAQDIQHIAQQYYQHTYSNIHNLSNQLWQYSLKAIQIQAYQLQEYQANIHYHSKQIIDQYHYSINHYQQQVYNSRYTLTQYQAQLNQHYQFIIHRGQESISQTENLSKSLTQFILGLGPEKTLQRGFSYITSADQYITNMSQAKNQTQLNIHFQDGTLSVQQTQPSYVKPET
ncbi:exodeoxyribonuclease VII large subunit [Piscirickettsia salmonis]|uniref:exodeoxyribonuclease VII large subunit n=1 Tax=Piscirickettsia salmonis TaxID=1238 RepID=UPI003A807EE4